MVDKTMCCGCRACEGICPKKAINWSYDEKGFGFPTVDNKKCVNCGLCEKVCPILQSTTDKGTSPSAVFGAYGHNRENSTSGGVFYFLAQHTLQAGGAVVGAVLDESMCVRHLCSEKSAVIERMRGSKYIQSDMNGVYETVEKLLRARKPVLFTGTPCQSKAMELYLKNRRVDVQNLTLCDLICHGVGSPRIFQEYIKLCEKRSRKQIVDHRFRSKYNGWHRETSCNVFADGSKDFSSHESQMLLNVYFDNVIQRSSCIHCPFACATRHSDITIGDFWGIENIKPELDDNKGISVVLCNTEKGKHIFESIKPDLTVMEFTMEEAMRKQPHLSKPLQYGKKYEQFWSNYRQGGFELVARKMYRYGFRYDVIRGIKDILRPIKKAVNKSK